MGVLSQCDSVVPVGGTLSGESSFLSLVLPSLDRATVANVNRLIAAGRGLLHGISLMLAGPLKDRMSLIDLLLAVMQPATDERVVLIRHPIRGFNQDNI